MKVDIVVVYIHRYRRGHEVHFVPPITGIHLAALTPVGHTVRVIHQQVEEVNLDSDADVIALSFVRSAQFQFLTLASGPATSRTCSETFGTIDSVGGGNGRSCGSGATIFWPSANTPWTFSGA